MALYVNKVTLVGNVGKEPVFITTKNGSEMASFSLATSRGILNKNTNTFENITDWHRIIVFKEHAVNISKSLGTGSYCMIDGFLQSRKFIDKTGREGTSIEVVAENVFVLQKVNTQQFNNNFNVNDSGYNDNFNGYNNVNQFNNFNSQGYPNQVNQNYNNFNNDFSDQNPLLSQNSANQNGLNSNNNQNFNSFNSGFDRTNGNGFNGNNNFAGNNNNWSRSNNFGNSNNPNRNSNFNRSPTPNNRSQNSFANNNNFNNNGDNWNRNNNFNNQNNLANNNEVRSANNYPNSNSKPQNTFSNNNLDTNKSINSFERAGKGNFESSFAKANDFNSNSVNTFATTQPNKKTKDIGTNSIYTKDPADDNGVDQGFSNFMSKTTNQFVNNKAETSPNQTKNDKNPKFLKNSAKTQTENDNSNEPLEESLPF